MGWAVAGLFYAFFNAGVTFINEKFQLDPALLGMYRGFGSFILVFPFIFFVAPPTNVGFWLFAVLQGLMVGFFDYKLFGSSAKFGAGGTSMMTVLSIVLTIVAWWFIKFSRLEAMLHHPVMFIFIILSILGCIKGFLSLTGNKIDKSLFKYMWPAIITLSAMTINSKNITSRTTLEKSIVYYIVMIGGIGGLFNFVVYFLQSRQHNLSTLKNALTTANALKGGILMVIFSFLLMVYKNVAMRDIPNPGYLNLLALTSPLWIFGINYLAKIRTRVSIKAAIFTIICIGVLVVLSGIDTAATPY